MLKRGVNPIIFTAALIIFLTGCENVDRDNSFTKRITFTDNVEAKESEKDKIQKKGSKESGLSGPEKTEPDDIKEINYTGRYDAVGIYLNDYYVKDEMIDGWYLELNEDKAGYMFFGEDNQGDISEWLMDGDKLILKAGVSVFEGNSTIKDGILLLDFENDMIIAFCSSEKDLTRLNVISADEYMELTKNE